MSELTGRVKVLLPKLMCKHLPSGRIYESKWTAAQHHCFCFPDSHSARTLQKVCDELVAKWNRQQPETWQYWLE